MQRSLPKAPKQSKGLQHLILERIMNTTHQRLIFTVAILTASSLSTSQNIGLLQGLSGSLLTPLYSSTEAIGLNSSPLFNMLPTNPLLTTYTILLDDPTEAIIIGDLVEGTLVINGILDGVPGGTLIRQTVDDIGLGELPLPISGLINSQF